VTVQAKSYPLPIAQPAIAALVPCSHGSGCPLGVDVPAMALALEAGNADLAFRYARAANPFASSCGHGCHAPCERGCRRRYFGAPVAIAALERHAAAGDTPRLAFPAGPCTSAHDARSVAGLVGRTPADALQAPRSGHRVAVVGAGVTGLACAHDLALLGHDCVVFDARDEPGGVLTSAIPAFRFPVSSARAECAAILGMGVGFQSRYPVRGSGDLRALLAGEFDAIFLAIGAPEPRDAPFPGQPEHARVTDAMHLLAEQVPVDGATVVIGDGDLAVDAARTAVRRAARDGMATAHVFLVLEKALEESDVAPEMIAAAVQDGITLHAGWTAGRYLVDEHGALSGVQLARSAERLSKVIACDAIVAAGPRAPLSAGFRPEVVVDGNGFIMADPDTLQTSLYGVWAGGACVFGHRSIAHAAADGKRAAWQIHAALTRRPVSIAMAAAWVEADDWDAGRAARALGAARLDEAGARTPPADPFSAASREPARGVAADAARCFDCTVLPVVDESCTSCGKCVSACPEHAFQMAAGSPPAPRQLRLDADVCTRCGICVGACPESAIALLRAVWEERLIAAPAGAPAVAPPPRRYEPTVHRPTPVG